MFITNEDLSHFLTSQRGGWKSALEPKDYEESYLPYYEERT